MLCSFEVWVCFFGVRGCFLVVLFVYFGRLRGLLYEVFVLVGRVVVNEVVDNVVYKIF